MTTARGNNSAEVSRHVSRQPPTADPRERTLAAKHEVGPSAAVTPALLHLEDRGRVGAVLPPERARRRFRKRVPSEPGLERGRVQKARDAAAASSSGHRGITSRTRHAGSGSGPIASWVVVGIAQVIVRVTVAGERRWRSLVPPNGSGFGRSSGLLLLLALRRVVAFVLDVEVGIVRVLVVVKVLKLFVG